jgi:uncharacterized membrane protein YkoI
MRRSVLLTCAAVGAFAFAGSTLRAAEKGEKKDEEKDLKQAQVPKPVLDAVAKKYPNAKLKKFGQENEEGKLIYEVELVSASKEEVSIDVSPEGNILAEETVMKASALPGPIKAGLQASKYKTWKIAKAERVVHGDKPDAPEYEVVVQSKKEKFEVVLDKDGKITKEEAKSGKDTD